MKRIVLGLAFFAVGCPQFTMPFWKELFDLSRINKKWCNARNYTGTALAQTAMVEAGVRTALWTTERSKNPLCLAIAPVGLAGAVALGTLRADIPVNNDAALPGANQKVTHTTTYPVKEDGSQIETSVSHHRSPELEAGDALFNYTLFKAVEVTRDPYVALAASCIYISKVLMCHTGG